MIRDTYDLVCSIGELIDKLSIENIKCYDANTRILAERNKPGIDYRRISDLEFNARKAGEQRVRLRDEINKRLAEVLERGEVQAKPEIRTYTNA